MQSQNQKCNAQKASEYGLYIIAESLPLALVTQLKSFVAEQFSLLAEHSLPKLDRAGKELSGLKWSLQAVGSIDEAKCRAELNGLAHEYRVELVLMSEPVPCRKLIAFDMDSTLIQHEVIDELAIEAGIGDQVAAITESAMRGEIDFKESFTQRMALLKGLSVTVLETIADRLRLTDGAIELVNAAKESGYKVAIISGGFNYFASKLQERLAIDHIFANELPVENGQVTGAVGDDIIDAKRKAEVLVELMHRYGLAPEQVVAVGDGANDLKMLATAGLGVAYHAKPLVQQQAQYAIHYYGLDAIIYLLGIQATE